MSISRLWVRISKCSRESLSTCGPRMTQKRRMCVGRGTGPATLAPVRSAVSTICPVEVSSILWSNAFRMILTFCLACIRLLHMAPVCIIAPGKSFQKLNPKSCAESAPGTPADLLEQGSEQPLGNRLIVAKLHCVGGPPLCNRSKRCGVGERFSEGNRGANRLNPFLSFNGPDLRPSGP